MNNIYKKKVLMISSSKIGGGPLQMINLGIQLNNEFDICFAFPTSKILEKYIVGFNHLKIKERKVSLLDLLNLIKFINSQHVDLIHAHGKGAVFIARIIKIFIHKPLIYSFHGVHLQCHNFFQKMFYLIYENIFGFLDTYKIFVSKSELYSAKKFFLIGKKYSIIFNSVEDKNIREINSEIDNSAIGIENDKKNIISVMRLVPQKNVFELIKIAKILKNYNFIILGEGPLENEINSTLKIENMNNVFLFGLKENVFEYLYSSSLFLSTSLYEGLSLSMLEAMSIGLPIVASNVAGNSDAVEHYKSGFLYQLGDINAATYYIRKILSNSEIEARFSKESYFRQRDIFNSSVMRKSYAAIYKKFIR